MKNSCSSLHTGIPHVINLQSFQEIILILACFMKQPAPFPEFHLPEELVSGRANCSVSCTGELRVGSHSHYPPGFFTFSALLPPWGHLLLTAFPALFVSPIRLLDRCCNLWFAGQLPQCSCCDLHSWRSRLLHYSWWPGGPVTSSVHRRGQTETCLASFLLSLGCSKTDTHRLTKTLRVSVFPGINPTRTSLGLLLNSDSHFLPTSLCYKAMDHQVLKQCWAVD